MNPRRQWIGAALLVFTTPVLALAPARSQARPPEHRAEPLATINRANARALREPSASRYVNAAQLYVYQEGAVYRLVTAPERVSDIALQSGETLVSVAAGDTARWVIGDTTSGTGAARRTHILVKPSASGLRTNLVVTTDRRVYLINLESTPAAAMPAIAWSYPQDELLTVMQRRGAAPAEAGVSVERLNFNYEITGDRPDWRPLRAFDDGAQIFIEFPRSIGSGEAPPLFLSGADGKAQLVNYRIRGRYYVVDRLFAAAELRLGAKRQQVVRILRRAPRAEGRGR